MYPWLANAVENSAVIVTASRRLARDLHKAHTRQQIEKGQISWRTARIHFRDDWLNKLIDSVDSRRPWPVRIDENSAAILWERCLARHTPDPLLSFANAVRLCRKTWRRLHEHAVPLEEITRFARSPDHQQFARAASMYSETLRSNNWIDAAQLPALVANALESRTILTPENVLFAGFDRLSPAMEYIVEQLRNQNCKVVMASVADPTATLVSRTFRDRQQELRAAGHWARRFLQKSPRASVVIICPDLQENAEAAARLVREGLSPGWQYAGEAARNAVDVSYGQRLCDYPAISVALLLLRWVQQSLPSRDIGILLRSPFVVGQSVTGRSRCELELRRWPDRAWTPASLASLLRGTDESEDTHRWHAAVERLGAFTKEHRDDASPAVWAERFDRLLTALGWPGESVLDSAGYQLLNRWRTMLSEFAATGLVTPRLSMTATIERICSMATEVIFQPELEGGIVQLLGALEASGLSFDAAWVCGMDSTRWPPPPDPLALVARALQEKYSMPDASAHDNFALADLVLRRVRASASEVVLSWASSDGETELSPSQLLAGLSLTTDDGLTDPGWHAMHLQDPIGLVSLDADPAPPLMPGEKVAGGAYTVQLQASEPFSAFACGRLRIREIPAIESGLSAALKGSIMHKALQAFLADKPDSSTIAAWTVTDISARIDRAVSLVLVPVRMHLDATHRKLLEFERQRLHSILKRFVASERTRPPFVIEHVEYGIDFERFGVRLALRVDRIDRLVDNSRLIIDYKTGTPKALLDRDGNLLDLQLVVYAMAAGAPIGGLALMNIDSRAISYKGTGGSVDWDTKRRADWAARLNLWIESAESAMHSLGMGDVRVDVHGLEQESRSLAILSRVEELKRVG